MITAAQCKAARELLGWDYGQLAEAAGSNLHTAIAFEMGRNRPRRATREKLRAAFEAAGVVFPDGDVPVARLRAVGGP